MHLEALTFKAKKMAIKFRGIKILPPALIAASKAYALGRRATYKDYADLYFIVREKYCSLDSIIADAKKIYGDEFGKRLFLEQLVYLKDVKDMPISFLKKPVARSEVESFFRKEIQKMKL